jgi:asparagine synthase (glutamine-hydrolysing)
MGGFVGIVNASGQVLDPTQIQLLSRSLAFRGPDGLFTVTDGMAALGMSLFHTGALQAVKSIPHFENSLWLIGDVRLDGRAELIASFDSGDRPALTRLPDADLILHSYRRWGDDCLSRLSGEFSFAIWDGTRRRLFAARDQIGVKPFFFTCTEAGLVLSNTLRCIRANPGISTDLDPIAIADFLMFGALKDASATAFSAIRRLAAGHSLVYEAGTLRISRYWIPDFNERSSYRRQADEAQYFREVLQKAVDDRITGQRTAILMSGGLDSTAVAAAARTTQTQIKAFTVVYDGLIPDEERHYSGVAANFLNVPVEYLAADDFELYDDGAQREPFSPEPVDEPLVNVFLSHLRQVQAYSPVALTGQGGDGIFAVAPGLGTRMLRSGGFRKLATGAWRYIQLRGGIPPLGFRGSLKRALSVSSAQQRSGYPEWLNPDFEARFRLREHWHRNQAASEPQSARDVILDPFWSNLLEGYDAGFTDVLIDVRHPLLDLRVIRYCLSLDPLPWAIDKTLLRVAMQGRLPPEILHRSKRPVDVDPVAFRLSRECSRIDGWKPSERFGEFVAKDRIHRAGSVNPPDLRPFALNRWLARIDD